MQWDAGILVLRQLISIILHNFYCAWTKQPSFYFQSKIWWYHHVARPDFL